MSSERFELEAELRQLEIRVAELQHELEHGAPNAVPEIVDVAGTKPLAYPADVILVNNAQGVCQAIHTAKTSVLGVATDAWVGAKVGDVLSDNVAKPLLTLMNDAVEKQTVQASDLAYESSDGARESYRAWMIPQPAGGVLALLVAPSQDRWLIAKSEELKQQVADKNHELQQFTYRVSHDLKGPLVSIKGFSELLREDLRDGVMDEVQDHLNEIVEAAEKMQFLIDRILDLSRVGTATIELVSHDATELIQGAMKALVDSIETSGATIQVAEPLPRAIGDRKQLTTVFQHLIDNACKYVRAGVPPQIEVGARREVGRVVWYVSDQGAGIDAENLTSIFEIFQRFEPAVPGAGVGLALTKRIVELHGGRIWVESPGLGKGATVNFTLGQTDPLPSK
jgi:signal transduction histidine kinase